MATLYGSSNHPIVEVLIDGVWTDVSTRVRNAQRVDITRGRSSEQGRTAAQSARLTFDNADGFFSTRLPSSVNYRKIGKNTQIRVRAGEGDNHMRTLYDDRNTSAGAVTSDKASLDVTGDLDLRMEVWPHRWRPSGNTVLAAKYLITGNQRSWVWRLLTDGRLRLTWSVTGTGTVLSADSTVPVPAASGRLAIRVTLDVDSGSGNRTITFYTAPSISSTWTALGAPVVAAGTTSIFAGTARLTLARGDDSAAIFSGGLPLGGRLYGFEMRNGINAPLVADFSPDDQPFGTMTWSDTLAAPNAWTVSGSGARMTSDRCRFWGELASLPKEWDASGTDVTVPARGAGMLQRLSQGVKALDSAMTRNFRGAPLAFAWWPLEDEPDATVAANLAPAVTLGYATPIRSTIHTGKLVDARFGDGDRPPGAKSSLAFSSQASRFSGRIDLRDTFAPAAHSLTFYIRVDALPASGKTFFSMDLAGPIARVDVGLSATAWDITFFDALGTQITAASTAIGLINPAGAWVGYNLLLTDDGVNASYSQRWDTIGAFGGGTGPTAIPGYTVGAPSAVRFTAANDAIYSAMKISHIYLTQEATFDLSNDTYRDASNAYRGETAANRLVRLAAEEGVPMEVTGSLADSEPMGYQQMKTLPDLLAECWEVDGGIGGEARDALTLEYRTRADLEARQDLVLSHASSDLSQVPRPTDDDSGFTNDVTLTRTDGASHRTIVTEGFTSVSDPPAGVGRYNSDPTLNIATDERLPSVSGWLALAGAWDADRYPTIEVGLHRVRLLADDALFKAVIGARLGDTVTLADLPSWMPPDRVPQIAQGCTEQLSKFLWDISWNASPAGPHQAIPLLGSDLFVPRLDAEEHTSGGALTTTATSVTLVTPAGSARWVDSATHPADFPFEIVIDGEVMSVTAITGTASPQTATVARSVNGVVKSHSAGALVRLASPFHVGR